MRTIGIVLLIIGGLIIYLAWKGKIAAAFNSLLTGQTQTSQNSLKQSDKQTAKKYPGYGNFSNWMQNNMTPSQA